MKQIKQLHADTYKVKKAKQKQIAEKTNRKLKKVTEKLYKIKLELATTATKVFFYKQYYNSQQLQQLQ